MILTCPACNTHYRVDDAALSDPAGRDLRCANCGHRWRYVPATGGGPTGPTESPSQPAPVASAPMPLVASVDPEPATMASPPSPSASPPPSAKARGSRAGLGCLALIVILAIAVAGVVLARDRIVALWPPAGKFYRSVGLHLEPLGAGLEISKVTPSRNADALVINGEVANTAGTTRTVPRLRIILRDAGGKELANKTIDPPEPQLASGAVARFRTQFEHPSDAATDVAVTFTAGE
jgi:predicted Zn finger-like uncharacterized protein